MNKRKEFSVLKWLVFPSMSLTLAAIVAWFNIVVFGLKDGAFYIAAVAIIAAFSIAINKYVGAENSRLAVAAFLFEILLILVLGANAIYSLSIQREMAVARQVEQSNIEALREIKQLKSRQAQRDATRMVAADKKDAKTSQTVFAENERILLWLMAGELLAYILSAFTLYALSHLAGEKEPTLAERYAEEFPESLEIENRPRSGRPNLTPKTTTSNDIVDDTRNHRKTTPDDTGAGFKRLREALKLIAFEHPPGHFKVDLSKKGDYLIIRHMESNRGDEATTHSCRAKLSLLIDAVKMERNAFRERLERFLRENGFEI